MTLAPYPGYRSSPLTPTGVAPKRWLDGAVKRGFRITLGKMVVASNENDDRTTQPYLRSANVQDGWLALEDVKEMYFSPTEAASLSLLEGDLVICEGGDCKDDPLDDLLEQSVLHITADDGDVRAPREAACDVWHMIKASRIVVFLHCRTNANPHQRHLKHRLISGI